MEEKFAEIESRIAMLEAAINELQSILIIEGAIMSDYPPDDSPKNYS